MRILVLNCGSSSVKFAVVDVFPSRIRTTPGEGAWIVRDLITGAVTGIGQRATLDYCDVNKTVHRLGKAIMTSAEAVTWILDLLAHQSEGAHVSQIEAVGHRVVHGGTRYTGPTLVTDRVIQDIADLCRLAPLHNPISLEGIRSARTILGPSIPMVAVFDTSFHRTVPIHAQSYALPRDLVRKHQIHRYGFHGIAHASLAAGYANLTGRSLAEQRLVTLQLGNGCSVTAHRSGQSIETSMGFTPLEGLVMGTRSGDLDPAVVSFLVEHEGVSAREVEHWLNEKSGLLGISGRSNDMRTLLAAADTGDPDAALAIEVFCYRIVKYIGAYLAVLGGADALIFGGGIGEKAPAIRQRVCHDLQWCGVQLDRHANEAATGVSPGEGVCITTQGSSLPVYVVGTAEEYWIARETAFCLHGDHSATDKR